MEKQTIDNGLTPYLQTESEVSEVLTAAGSIEPSVQSYGGDNVPRAVVLVQQYAVSKKLTQKTGIFKKKMTVKQDDNGNVVMIEVDKEKGTFKPELIDSGKYREVRTTNGTEIQNTLSVIPLRAKCDKNTLNHVLGCNFSELETAIKIGKPIERKVYVNGSKEPRIYRMSVKTTIRRGAILHLFVREGNKVLSTVQVNGGITGSALLADMSGSFTNLYNQIKAAQESEKPAQISEAILTALGMKKGK